MHNLYISAQRIPNWINSNNIWEFQDGDTYFCFKNPDTNTRNSPDINNSSISLCIRDFVNNNLFFLTGDTGYTILESCYKCSRLTFLNSVLKVSHHGSITGTSLNYLNLINPNYAFISAGNHRKFDHPDRKTLGLLKFNNVDIEVSRYNYYSYVEYESTNQGITKKCVFNYE
jgi:beta-lactamase superfamily II metal-dependent hydrolase